MKAMDGEGAGLLEQSECLTAVGKPASLLAEEESSGMESGKEEPEALGMVRERPQATERESEVGTALPVWLSGWVWT